MSYNVNDIYDSYLKKGIIKTATDYSKSTSWVRWILRQNNKQLKPAGRRSNRVNETYFERIDTPDRAYFLGLMAADGCISSTRNSIKLSLKREDSSLLYLLKNRMSIHNSVIDKKYSSIEFSSQKIKEDLKKHGVTPQKTFTISWPKLSPNLYPHYIRGYIDGDGCWFVRSRPNTKDTIGLQIVCASYKFLNELQQHFKQTLDIKGKVPYKIKSANCYELKYTGNNLSSTIRDYVYPNSMGEYCMKRKYKIAISNK